ncbi:MAG: hypothetical protein ACFCD0_01475 [Gemmataceae bacterium]
MEFVCPNCQQKLMIADEHIGQLILCPTCTEQFHAQAPSDYRAEPPQRERKTSTEGGQPWDNGGTEEDWDRPRRLRNREQDEDDFHRDGASTHGRRRGPDRRRDGYYPEDGPRSVRRASKSETLTLPLSPMILGWIPCVGVFLIIVTSFFTWLYAQNRGIPVLRQNVWQAAFGSVSLDSDIRKLLNRGGEYRFDDVRNIRIDQDYRPGLSFPIMMYLLMFLLLIVPLSVVLPLVRLLRHKLPRQFRTLLRFGWALFSVLAGFLFSILLVQLTFGFAMESKFRKEVYDDLKAAQVRFDDRFGAQLSDEELRALERGMRRRASFVAQTITQRSLALSLAFWIHFWTILVAGLLTWHDLRNRDESIRVEVHW